MWVYESFLPLDNRVIKPGYESPCGFMRLSLMPENAAPTLVTNPHVGL